jgi:hypothetical protein
VAVVVALAQIPLVQMVVLAAAVQDQQPAVLVEPHLVLIRMPVVLDKVTVDNLSEVAVVAVLLVLARLVLLLETVALESC